SKILRARYSHIIVGEGEAHPTLFFHFHIHIVYLKIVEVYVPNKEKSHLEVFFYTPSIALTLSPTTSLATIDMWSRAGYFSCFLYILIKNNNTKKLKNVYLTTNITSKEEENEILTANFTMDEEVIKTFIKILYRPICLIDVSFKIITKVLTNRIGLLDGVILKLDFVMLELNKCLEYDLHYSLIFGCGIGSIFFWQGGSSKTRYRLARWYISWHFVFFELPELLLIKNNNTK
ncbi:hypothetical protein ACJX0J_029358, partial [Zea mays]